MIDRHIGGLIGLIILIGDIIAIFETGQSSATTNINVLWIVAIIVFPMLGLLLWLVPGRKAAARVSSSHSAGTRLRTGLRFASKGSRMARSSTSPICG